MHLPASLVDDWSIHLEPRWSIAHLLLLGHWPTSFHLLCREVMPLACDPIRVTCHLRCSILGLLTLQLVFSKTGKVRFPLCDEPLFGLLRAVVYELQCDLSLAITSLPLWRAA